MSFVHEQFYDEEHQKNTYELGIWCFLASEWMLFSGLVLIYLYARWAAPEIMVEGSLGLDRVLGTLNTAILLTSSLTVAYGVQSRLEGRKSTWKWLLLSATLGCMFLAIKGLEWSHELQKVPEEPGLRLFFFLYFAITGVHALHLFVGVAVLTALAWLDKVNSTLPAEPNPVVMTGVYWHLVDLIWVFIFPAFYLLEHGLE